MGTHREEIVERRMSEVHSSLAFNDLRSIDSLLFLNIVCYALLT